MAQRLQRVASLMSQGTSRLLPSSRALRSAHVPMKEAFPFTTRRTLGVMTPKELEKRIDGIKRLAKDAQLCIKDCGESIETEDFGEDIQSANIAVDAAGVAYSELLEELALTDEGVEVLNEVRRLRLYDRMASLRQELKNIGKTKDDDDEE
mmetsp:Transcript_10987/g.24247  ORF Transcript_10987/g.24247 Transcript_10987/m.24247 type:complete len:151 (+) Transcript_10987:285-737(+)|eukprot:CAMPEP_0172307512 /NCGR_PEP_ID=MMETSP1058-20130122/8346_1 /TAXON_ID=83371 /ORGANISM="Detonula confervacea, Strain CCMP 353" /LENGTH=150 /DNA_ID=CAMNT_0013019693 /DNA_START=278 /DNA_END=730 /DNA_ORIENTATION=+